MTHYMTVAPVETRRTPKGNRPGSRFASTRPSETPELPAHIAEEAADVTLCGDPTERMRAWAEYPQGAARHCDVCKDALAAGD